MVELGHTLKHLSLEQHALALMFLLAYGVSLGSLLGPIGRLRCLLMALLAAGAFAARTDPWEHGVLLMLGAIGGLGLFIGLAWLLSALARRRLEAVADRGGRIASPDEPRERDRLAVSGGPQTQLL